MDRSCQGGSRRTDRAWGEARPPRASKGAVPARKGGGDGRGASAFGRNLRGAGGRSATARLVRQPQDPLLVGRGDPCGDAAIASRDTRTVPLVGAASSASPSH